MATTKDMNIYSPSGPWFESQYPGKCVECGEPFVAGTMVRYNADGLLVTSECGDVDTLVTADTFAVMDNSKDPHPVMPPGRTVADRCNRCFLIHTPAQGNECQ